MSTIVTRLLKGNDNVDVQAIKVESEDFKDRWGVIEVEINTYDWASASGTGSYPQVGTVDIRSALFNPVNDTPVIDKVTLNYIGNPSSPVSVGKKYFFAVNNGVLGPAGFAQPDGSWDLLLVEFLQIKNNLLNEGMSVTVDYTISFTDLTPISNPTANGSATLTVDNANKLSDKSTVTFSGATLAGNNGYIQHQLVNMVANVIDVPPGSDSTVNPGDSVPLFAVVNTATPIGFGQIAQLCMHPLSKKSGTKIYSKRLFVWAVNDGKIDGNGMNVSATTAFVSLIDYQLAKVQEWVCDDLVTIVANHYTNWTQVV